MTKSKIIADVYLWVLVVAFMAIVYLFSFLLYGVISSLTFDNKDRKVGDAGNYLKYVL